MDRGYVRLWRKIEDSPVWTDPTLFYVFLWCLLKAAYKPRVVGVKTGRGVTQVSLTEGQFIFGRHEAAAVLKMPASTVRDKIKKLTNLGMVDTKPDTHYSLITIINWDTYQGCPTPNRQASDTQPTPIRHKQEVEEVKEVKTKPSCPSDERFEIFWTAYPEKKKKGAARKAWDKAIKKTTVEVMVEAIQKQKKSRKWQEGYIPYPATWLNAEEWLNENTDPLPRVLRPAI